MDVVFILKVLKALLEVAGFALLGQGVVALFAGAKRDQNFVYVLFKIISSPVTRLTRFICPRFIPDRHIPFYSFGLVFWAWAGLIICIFWLTAKQA